VSRRFVVSLVAGVLAALVAATAVALSSGDDPAPRTGDREPPAAGRAVVPPAQVLVVRRRGGVPASWSRRFRRTPGVTAIASTERTQVLLRHSRRAGGRTVEAIRAGYAIPLDVLVTRPRTYGRVVGQAKEQFARLRHGTALLSRTSARLRRLGAGDRIALTGGRELRVAGVVDDDLVGFAELVLTRADSGAEEGTRQLLVATTEPERTQRLFSRKGRVRVRPLSRTQPPTRRLIARPLETKTRFGEFAVGLPYGADWIHIDPHWLRRNIVTRTVPILGSVTCNRQIFPPLHRALRALERRGLSHVVDRADYAGCFAPRRIPSSGALSLHAWGLPIDINASANPRLGESSQDRRLVRAMENAGFTWGGRWPTVPDPMHFELHP
jgi:D-alanyl-D-alanine carboxypeptidase